MRENTRIDDYQERAADKCRIAEQFASRGDYQQALYRLSEALADLSTAISELKHRD